MSSMPAYKKEFNKLSTYIIALAVLICGVYAAALFGSDRLLTELGSEDGITEWLTALLFLLAAVLFFISFRRTKNIFLLGLSILFVFGAGEEISWGQRLFNFATPESLKSMNMQEEFNIHNLELLNPLGQDGTKKTGLERLLEIDLLFRIFCIGYCVLLPLYFYHIRFAPSVKKGLRMPVPPFSIGIFVIVSWVIFNLIKKLAVPRPGNTWQYMNNGEIFEFTTALIFFAIALYFVKDKNSNYLGKDIKQNIR
jgi:hypothetical protein